MRALLLLTLFLIGCDKQDGRFQLLAGTYEVSYGPIGSIPANTEKQPGVFMLDTATGQIWHRLEVLNLNGPSGAFWVKEEIKQLNDKPVEETQ